MKFQTMMKRSWRGLKRASPTILAVASGIGVVVTAVLSAKATPKVMIINERYEKAEAEGKTGKHLDREIVMEVCKCYAPAVISGTATILCIAGGQIINRNRQKELVGAYVALGAAFSSYKSQVAAKFGEDVEKSIQLDADKSKKEVEEDEKLYTFIDSYRDKPYERTWSDVLAAEYNVNYYLQVDGCVSLNQFYQQLDLPPIEGGDEIGWSLDTLIEDLDVPWVPFINTPFTLDDGMQMTKIEIASEPRLDYMNY